MKKLFGASKKEAVTPWREAPPSGLNLEPAADEDQRLRRPISQQLSPKLPYTNAPRSSSPAHFESTRNAAAFGHTAYPSYGESHEVPHDRHVKTASLQHQHRYDGVSLGRSAGAESAPTKARSHQVADAAEATAARSGKSGVTNTDYASEHQQHIAANDGSVDLSSVRQALPAAPPSAWNAPQRAHSTAPPAAASPGAEVPASSAHSSPRLGRWKSLRRSAEGRQASYDDTLGRSREAPAPRPYANAAAADATPYPSYAPPEAFVQVHKTDIQSTYPDKPPKRKLFGFGGMGKEKKDRDVAGGAAPTQEHTSDPGTNAAASAAYASDPSAAALPFAKQQQQQQQQGSKEHSWYDVRGVKGSAAKNTEGIVANKIGWLCANSVDTWDWNNLLELADTISHSEAAAREAARAVRKELKYGESEPRKRAVKVWAVLTLNGSDRFKMQIANKRFLEVVEELVTSTKTPFKLKELLIDVFGMLAYEFKDDAELALLTKSYNKVKPSDYPLNGTPLDAQHPIFAPATGADVSAARKKHRSRLPSPNEDIRRLHEECAVARSSVQMLFESLGGSGMDPELVAEFSEKIQHSHDFISAQIPWATAQADLSRSRENEADMRAAADGRHVEPPSATKEENLLGDLLDANEKLTEARSMLEATQARHFEEDDEERRVLERSRVEVRLDRSALQQDPITGEFYDLESSNHSLAAPPVANRASGSGKASPQPRLLPTPSSGQSTEGHPAALLAGVQGHARQASASSASSRAESQRINHAGLQHAEKGVASPPHLESQRATPATGTGHIGGPRPLPAHPSGASSGSLTAPAPPASSASLQTAEAAAGSAREQQLQPLVLPTQRDAQSADDTGDTESIIETPIQPSEKALGKRRQFSDRGDAFDPAVQEDALARANAAAQVRDEGELRTRPPPPVPARVPAPSADAVASNGFVAASPPSEQPAAGALSTAPQQWAPTNPFHPSALRPGQAPQRDAAQGTNPFAVHS